MLLMFLMDGIEELQVIHSVPISWIGVKGIDEYDMSGVSC